MTTVAILCGGQGTRVAHIAQGLPKSLIPIHGRPFLGYQLDLLKRAQVDRVVLCVGVGARAIIDFVDDGSRWGLEVHYSHDGNGGQLGTGGALRHALPLLGSEFIVLYGDVYLAIDYGEMLRALERNSAAALVATCTTAGLRHDAGNITWAKGYAVHYDKWNHDPEARYQDAGALALRASVFDQFREEGPLDLADVMYTLGILGQLWGWATFHKPHEIGSPDGIREFEKRTMRANFPR